MGIARLGQDLVEEAGIEVPEEEVEAEGVETTEADIAAPLLAPGKHLSPVWEIIAVEK